MEKLPEEMASLAIQTTSQQSLFSDKRMGAFSAVGNHPSLEFDHTPKDTPPTLPSFKKGERKTVQFSDQNEVYEIDSLDTAYLSDILYEQTVNSPHTTPNLQESIDEETDTVDSVDTVDAVDTVDSVDAVDAVDAVDSVDSVDSVDAVDAVDTILRNTLTLNTFTRDSASHGNDYGDSDSMSSVSSPSITSFEETESLCSRDSTWESSSQTTQIPSTELVYGFDDKLLVELDRITETITKENEIQTDRLKGPSSYDHLSLIYTASGKLKNKQTQGQNTLVLCDDDLSDATSAVKEWKDSSVI
ncbi:hypothetical protein BDF14DRAFT_1352147 [Spinellus fusiger]|nr:hypothetical protein BDF14DRAFT_1352147 [Spinellus fusiger]